MTKHHRPGLLDYSKRLLSIWNGIYGSFTFGLLIIVLLGVDFIVPDWVLRLLLILSLFLGGYRVYRDVAPDLAELFLKVQDIAFQEGGWHPEFPSKPSVKLKVRCTNRGSGIATIDRLNVADLKLSSPLLVTKEETIYETPVKRGYPVHWPVKLEGEGDFKEFELGIAVEISTDNAEHFAKMLKGLNRFSLTVEVQYEDMDGNEHTERIEASASYDQFKQSAKENWKGRGKHELVYILEGLES